MRNIKHAKLVVLVSIVIFLSGLLVACAANTGSAQKSDSDSSSNFADNMVELEKNVATLISDRRNILDHLEANWIGEYFIDGVQQIGEYIFAVVGYYPPYGFGEPLVYLFVIAKENDNLRIVDFQVEHQLIMSMGVSVFKWTVADNTIIFGAVSDQIWLNLDEAPIKVEYTAISILHSSGQEVSINIGNHQTYLLGISGNVNIDDIYFISHDEVIGKLSTLQMDYIILH